MDDADRAAKLQADLNRSAAARRQPESGLTPQGWCYNCGSDIHPRALFCAGGECADEYERRERQRRQM